MTQRAAKTAKRVSPRRERRDYARWRAAALLLVYVLMAVHVTHWAIAGKTLAPLELNEVMYTFELGIVTAGFLFMAAVTLATLVVGRFFCSWGCHILALQDLCHWVLGKLHIRPRPIRSRALLWIPVVAALYMFVSESGAIRSPRFRDGSLRSRSPPCRERRDDGRYPASSRCG